MAAPPEVDVFDVEGVPPTEDPPPCALDGVFVMAAPPEVEVFDVEAGPLTALEAVLVMVKPFGNIRAGMCNCESITWVAALKGCCFLAGEMSGVGGLGALFPVLLKGNFFLAGPQEPPPLGDRGLSVWISIK